MISFKSASRLSKAWTDGTVVDCKNFQHRNSFSSGLGMSGSDGRIHWFLQFVFGFYHTESIFKKKSATFSNTDLINKKHCVYPAVTELEPNCRPSFCECHLEAMESSIWDAAMHNVCPQNSMDMRCLKYW